MTCLIFCFCKIVVQEYLEAVQILSYLTFYLFNIVYGVKEFMYPTASRKFPPMNIKWKVNNALELSKQILFYQGTSWKFTNRVKLILNLLIFWFKQTHELQATFGRCFSGEGRELSYWNNSWWLYKFTTCILYSGIPNSKLAI